MFIFINVYIIYILPIFSVVTFMITLKFEVELI